MVRGGEGMTKGYEQIHDNEWIEPTKKFVSQCCDCCLVHVYQFQVVDRANNPMSGAKLHFKVKVDRRKTAAARRKLKFTKDAD